MSRFDLTDGLLPVLFPQFYEVRDAAGNEFVLLRSGGDEPEGLPREVKDRTQFEAFENHVHLWGRVRKGEQETARRIGLAIARNLSETLKRRYPSKAFVVYLDLSFSDSTIVRFHQLWPGEPPYYVPGDFPQIVELR